MNLIAHWIKSFFLWEFVKAHWLKIFRNGALG